MAVLRRGSGDVCSENLESSGLGAGPVGLEFAGSEILIHCGRSWAAWNGPELPFPSPSPSPRGEGTFISVPPTRRAPFLRTRMNRLPLPEGEGWGEGKERVKWIEQDHLFSMKSGVLRLRGIPSCKGFEALVQGPTRVPRLAAMNLSGRKLSASSRTAVRASSTTERNSVCSGCSRA